MYEDEHRMQKRTQISSMAKISATVPCSGGCAVPSPQFRAPSSHFCGPLSFISRSPLILPLLIRTREKSRRRRREIATVTACLQSKQLSGATKSPIEHDQSLALKNKAVEVANELKGTSIFLVGMNGTMKTTLGKLLAELLRYYYFDSDSLVEQAAGGESAAKSFRETDAEGFRESETEVLKQLSSMGRLIICAGDGAVQSSTNLAFLRYGISVWIDVPLDMLAKELIDNGSQCPSIWDISSSDSFPEVVDKLTKRYEEMREGYGTADTIISVQKIASRLEYDDFESVTSEDMAMEALKEIEKLTKVKKMMEAAARPF